MTEILKLKNIGQIYENDEAKVEALKEVNFSLSEGLFNVLIGPSGCGKSTILRILAGMIKPTSGEVIWQRPLTLSFVFQNFALFPFMNVFENIEFGLKMKNIKKGERNEVVGKLIDEMGLQGFEERHPKELSGGMKQRVGLARALSLEPDLLLMDEPFSSLDEMTADNLREIVAKIHVERKLTILMVTHLVSEAVKLSDKIYLMSQRPGHILEEVNNKLPKPRQERSPSFYALEDKLKSSLM